jgi:hypothetical protein
VHCPGYLRDDARAALMAAGFLEAEHSDFKWKFGQAFSPNDPPTFFFPRSSQESRRLVRGASASTLAAFSGGRAVLSLPAPAKFNHRSLTYIRLVLRNLPLPLPVTRSTAKRVDQTAEATADGVLLLERAQEPWDIDVRLPTAGEALEDWVTDHGFTLTRSQDGRYAEALLSRLGSLDRLDVLADRKRIDILKALSPRSRVKLVRAFRDEAQLDENVIADKLADIGLFLEIEARTASEIGTSMGAGNRPRDVLRLLPPLVESGFIRRIVQVRCPDCRFLMLLTLAEQDEAVRCRACGAPAPLPVVDSSGDREPELFYQLDGLMARIMDQDVLPVLLTPRVFRPSADQLFFVWPGVELTRADRPRVDIDVLISNAAGVWAFEVKKSARRLTTGQLYKLLQACAELGAVPGIAALEAEFPEQLTRKVMDAGGQVLTAAQLLA